jgi:hypothetical protein
VKPIHFSALHFVIPVLAVFTTWVTGFWWRAGNGITEYGLPLPWKTEQVIPTCNMCPLPTSYNWVFFLIDIAFYAAIGHVIVLVHARILLNRKEC